MSYVERSDPSYSLNEFILGWMGPAAEVNSWPSAVINIPKQFGPSAQTHIFLRQCPEQDHQGWLCGSAVGVFFYCRTWWGQGVDHSGKCKLPAVHHTRTHEQTRTRCPVPPCWHPGWYHMLSTLSWLCFSQSLQARDYFNYWWAAEQWKWGHIDWGGQQLILPITSMRMFPSCADLPALLLPLEIRSCCIVPA